MTEPFTASVMAVLDRYAIDKGEALAREAGPAAAKKAGELLQTALTYLRRDPAKKVIADRYEQNPERAGLLLEDDLSAAIRADEGFAAQLNELLAQYWAEARADPAAGSTYRAQVPSGAAAQGEGAMAVGERAVFVGGNVEGNVYVGEPAQDPAEALRIYRDVLVRTSGHLPLRGVDVGASDPTIGQKPLGLANVYVDLNTTTQVEVTGSERVKGERRRALTGEDRETRPLTALEAAAGNRRLVLLGDPGGGKSTFVTHLAYCLAAHALQRDARWLADHLAGWPQAEGSLLPILVILRDFAHSLAGKLPDRAEAHHLWDFIKGRLKAQRLGFAATAIESELENGRALVLLDGLDEVASVAQRAFVRDAVLAFAGRYHPRNRYLVTCRVLSYQEPAAHDAPDLRLPPDRFPDFELAPFDEEKIDRFIEAWYAELERLGSVRAEDAAGLTARFRQAVRRPDLWRLAQNPLLLTVMALVHTHKGRLPDARALLYEDTVDILLWRWEQVKAGGQEDAPQLRQLLLAAGRTEMDLKRTLWRLAYEAHGQTGEDEGVEALAGIGELALKKALVRLADDDWSWAHQVVEAMKLRAGLLLEREPERFTFPHRTFQEFMAGAFLSAQHDFARRAAELAGEGTLWREVILLAAGRLVYLSGDIDKPLALVARLCPAQMEDSDSAWRKAWLAGDVLLEAGLKRVEDDPFGQERLLRVRRRLAALISQGKLAPRERAEAGDTLAQLGDLRPGVCALEPDLIPIPTGTFLMGDEKYEITLDTFAIARYLVTNAQFRYFVEDGGYTEKWRACWANEGWQERTERSWTGPRFWDEERFNQSNQPVVGVSWYEAVAYCNWLKKKTGKPYRLPTEAEWERAARHTDGRSYPWGEATPGPETTNFAATGLERPAAVGIFPRDTAVCSAQDMAGNVSEWCQTRWQDENGKEYPLPYRPDDGREDLQGDYTVYRVWRGGAWSDNEEWLRCSARWFFPRYGGDAIGIRVVVSVRP